MSIQRATLNFRIKIKCPKKVSEEEEKESIGRRKKEAKKKKQKKVKFTNLDL